MCLVSRFYLKSVKSSDFVDFDCWQLILCRFCTRFGVFFSSSVYQFLRGRGLVRTRAMRCFGFSPRERKGEGKSVRSAPASSIRYHNCEPNEEYEPSGRSSSVLNSLNTSDTSRNSSATIQSSCFSRRTSNDLRVFEFSELKATTKNFSRSLLVGEGGFGSVYRGTIRSFDDPNAKIEVAVKQLNKKGLQGHKEWLSEVNILGIVEHPNLVKLVGYCVDENVRGMERLLVYEFMHNGSVADHLYSCSTTIPWSARLRIALDAARGLTYLHEGMDSQIIFRDFKTSNILLDHEWNAKLSDFGLAREGPRDGRSHVSTAVAGTLGYAAPEYLETGHLTTKNDVWSYGVVLYELITGRRPFDPHKPKNEQKLLQWVKQYIADRKKFHMIMDRRLEGQYSLRIAQKLSIVANRCLVSQPKARPKMSEVLEMVSKLVQGNGNPWGTGISSSANNDDAPEASAKPRCSEKVLDVGIVGGERPVPPRIWTSRLIWTC